MQYVGDIRRILEQIAGCKPGTLHLVIMGSEQSNDSLQLGTLMQTMPDASAGLASLTVQVKQAQARIGSRSERLLAAPAALHALTSDVQEAILESSPDVTMSTDMSLVTVLTALLDTPPSAYDVHRHAYQLLCRLQTWQPLIEKLRSCMADSTLHADHTDINELFCLRHQGGAGANGAVSSWRPQPGAVLYTLEALYSLMEPAMPPKNGVFHPQNQHNSVCLTLLQRGQNTSIYCLADQWTGMAILLSCPSWKSDTDSECLSCIIT